MKNLITLLLLLSVGSLIFGCNSVITKPNLGKSDLVKKSEHNMAYVNHKINLYADSHQIDARPLASVASTSALFSTAWIIDNKPVLSNTRPNLAQNATQTLASRLSTQNNLKSMVGKSIVKVRTGKVTVINGKAGQSHRRYSVKHKLVEKNLNINHIIAKILAETKFPIAQRNNFIVAQNNNLWDRIRKGYKLPVIDNPNIQKEIAKFSRYPAYFKRISTRANPYLYHIVKEITKRGMPLEIALLPAIESAFKPSALSHKSAAGLWQFIPATGRYFGLKQNNWYDGRRDIAKSTTAALNYLQKLHKMFDDDWLLALAAYNFGEGNIRKAIKRNLARNKLTDFWSLTLPKETRQYVPKLLALAKIVANPKEYGVKLQHIANQRYLQKVRIDHQIDLSLAAKLAGLSLPDFKRLNSCHRRSTTAPQNLYITLPVHNVRQFKQRIAKMPRQLMLTKWKP